MLFISHISLFSSGNFSIFSCPDNFSPPFPPKYYKINIGISYLNLSLTQLIFSSTFFYYSSVGKEPTCNAGDPGSIPGSGRSAGEGIGYPLQYSRVSLVAQWVKNLPATQETGFYHWVGKIPWIRETLPTPVFWTIFWTI